MTPPENELESIFRFLAHFDDTVQGHERRQLDPAEKEALKSFAEGNAPGNDDRTKLEKLMATNSMALEYFAELIRR